MTTITRADLHKLYENDVNKRREIVVEKVCSMLQELITGKAKEGIFTWTYNLEDCIEQPFCLPLRSYGILKEYPDTYVYPRKRDGYFFREEILEKMKLTFPDCEMSVDGKMFSFDAS